MVEPVPDEANREKVLAQATRMMLCGKCNVVGSSGNRNSTDRRISSEYWCFTGDPDAG
ncbi:MAG: hypothetical protein ACLUD0_06920 [Eubacterium ramulus]